MNEIFQSLLSIFSGVLLSLAISNPIFHNGFMPCVLVALVPLYIAIRHCRNYSDAMRCSAIQALTVHLLSSYHLMFFRNFAVFTLGASALGTAGVASLFGALYFFPLRNMACYSVLCAKASGSIKSITHRHPEGGKAARGNLGIHSVWFERLPRRGLRPLLAMTSSPIPYPLHFAIAYTLYDWYKAEGIGFLAYPWGTLPCATGGFTSLAQTADLCGVWGMSFLFALLSAVIAETIISGGIRRPLAVLYAGRPCKGGATAQPSPRALHSKAKQSRGEAKCMIDCFAPLRGARNDAARQHSRPRNDGSRLPYPLSAIPYSLFAIHYSPIGGFDTFSASSRQKTLNHPIHYPLFTIHYSLSTIPYSLTLALFLCASIYGIVQKGVVREAAKTVTAVIVQQNADPWKSNEEENILSSERLTQEALDALAKKGARADVVVWSEGVLYRSFPDGEGRYYAVPEKNPLILFIMQTGVPFIIGGQVKGNAGRRLQSADNSNAPATPYPLFPTPYSLPNTYNAALLFGQDGRYKGFYAKLHLVPFAEVVPGVEYEWVRRFMKRVAGFSSGYAAGDKYTYFDISAHKVPGTVEVIDACAPKSQMWFRYATASQQHSTNGYPPPIPSSAASECKARIAVPICFDDAFASVCRPLFLNGAEAFFNITDDSWSLTVSAQMQHLALAKYRAIEYRTSLLRATNSGASVVVDAKGDVIQSLPMFKAASKAVRVPIYQRTMTVYAILGDWLPMLCALAMIAQVLWVRRYM